MTDMTVPVRNQTYSRRARRAGVLLMYFCYPLIPLGGLLAAQRSAGIAVMPLALIGFFAGMWLVGFRAIRARVFPYTVGVSDTALDERQRGVKYRAYRVSYWILAVLALAALTTTIVATTSGLFVAIVLTTWVTFLVVAYSLPFAVIAWTEPDR